MKVKITEYRIAMGAAIGLLPGAIIFFLLYFYFVGSSPIKEGIVYEPVAFVVICLSLISIALSSYAGSLREKHKM